MPTVKQIIFALLFIFALLSTATAQESASSSTQRSSLTITASAAGERVRITAPSSIVQMHVEVYAASGERVFDQEIRGGNVFDWHLQDGQGQRLAPGAYVCVVTAKSVSGKLTQKIGTVRVEEKSVSVQPAESLSAPQAQTIGPVEENSSWTIPGKDEPQTTTVIAHDGTDGQMIRGRGALTFRIGNFFSGFDQEQMRLTEEGNLGIGTSEPKARLDVAGTIRAERFLIAKPNKTGSDKTAAVGTAQATDSADSVQPLVSGAGTPGKLTKWFDNSGALVDSIITETASGNVGIGTTSPAAALTVKTANNKELLVRPASDFGGLSTAVALHATNSAYNASIPLAIEATTLTLNAATGGNVGIGTTNPFLKFQVRPVAGTNLAIGDTTGGWGFPGSLLDSVNDSSSLIPMGFNASKFFFANGNVGIGTTNPATKLMVQTNTGNYGFTHTDGTTTIGSYVGGSVSGASGGWFGTLTTSPLHFFTGGGQPSMTITPTGNVGIGTFAPSAKLHVAGGDLLFENKWRTETTTVNLDSGAVSGPPNLIGGFLGTGSGGGNPGNRVTAGVVGATIGGGGFAGILPFPSGGASIADVSNRVTDWFGTVGGGLANVAGNDDATLDNARFATVGGGAVNIASGSYATVPGGASNTAQGDYSFAAGNEAKANHNGSFVWADATGGDFASTGSNQFLIRASGGVGIGTNAPTARLSVVTPSPLSATENTATFKTTNNAQNQSHIHYGTNGDWYIRSAASAGKVILQDTGGFVGIGTSAPDAALSVNGGADKPGGGSWATFSDERLKNMKGRFTPGLKALMQLQPIRYEYKPDNALGIRSSGEHIGFGAQAVQKILPEAVSKNDRGYLLVNNDPIMWTMLNAIKEQQQTIEELQQQNNKLKARNADTESRLANVETTVKRMAQENRRQGRRK